MKKYMTESKNLIIGAYEENNKYYLIIEKHFTRIVATKGNKKAHSEWDYTQTKKEFNTPEQANNYFKTIKKNNPTLKEVK